MGAINNWGYNITEYVKLLQEYPIKLVSLILDLAIVIFVLIYIMINYAIFIIKIIHIIINVL